MVYAKVVSSQQPWNQATTRFKLDISRNALEKRRSFAAGSSSNPLIAQVDSCKHQASCARIVVAQHQMRTDNEENTRC